MSKSRLFLFEALPLLLLFFFSGFAALVYQVLWVRELGLLFGSTAQAAALSIAIFFLGLALGGWFWGRRASRYESSLRVFGLLELGVAATALGHFFVADAYHALYPTLYGLFGHHPILDTLMKALVAASILLPSAFLMGGTLPLMGQHLIRAQEQLAGLGSLLYAVNTAGSALGALAAGFYLPLALGFQGAYLLAVGVDAFVGLATVALAGVWRERRIPEGPEVLLKAAAAPPPAPTEKSLPPPFIWAVAFVSGFATLGVEVAWTRLFAQVLQNSVYTYSLVLTSFLVALSVGALCAGALAQLRRNPPSTVLLALLLLSACAIAVTPWVLHDATDGLRYVGADQSWEGYVRAVAWLAFTVLFLPAVVLGTVLPYLLRTLQQSEASPGAVIGKLIAVNTSGAILGSLAMGFVLLPTVGAYRGLLLLAALYPALGLLYFVFRADAPYRNRMGGLLAASAAVLALFPTTSLESIRLRSPSERVVEVREGSQAHVAVVGRGKDFQIRVNNYYTLGGTNGLDSERNQAVIPLLQQDDPKSVFFLGMGTGLTAGAALSFPVERVVVAELLADVVHMAEAHFGPWINGLFQDERATIYADDGRICLKRSPDRYDLIISDLFTPWKAGTGNLYTLEHFRTVYDRLEEGGAFFQWMPLYQVTEQEFGIIARTMMEVFPQVVLWRGDLFKSRSIVAITGYREARPLDPAVLSEQGRMLRGGEGQDESWHEGHFLRFYAGNLTESNLYKDFSLNTDNYPLIEYTAPQSHRRAATGEISFLVGAERESLYARLREAVPPSEDPFLARLSPVQLDYVEAGHAYSTFQHLRDVKQQEKADAAFARFKDLSPESTWRTLSPAKAFSEAFNRHLP